MSGFVRPPTGAALGARLRALRVAAGLTQKQLSERAGISRAYLAALERGLSSATKAPPNPSRKLLSAIASALSLPFEALYQDPALRSEAGSALLHFGDPSSAYQWPSNDGVILVSEPLDPGLGLEPGDAVLVRRLTDGLPPEGLCLLETPRGSQWGRIAHIAKQPYLGASDGSFRPLGPDVRAIAAAVAVVRSL